MIAMALSCEPELLICRRAYDSIRRNHSSADSRVDKDAETATGTSVILITHDLGIVAGMTDHLLVMYAGKDF